MNQTCFVSSQQSCILLSEPASVSAPGPLYTLGDKQTPLFAQLSCSLDAATRQPAETPSWGGGVLENTGEARRPGFYLLTHHLGNKHRQTDGQTDVCRNTHDLNLSSSRLNCCIWIRLPHRSPKPTEGPLCLMWNV